jgi:hypothetical protein
LPCLRFALTFTSASCWIGGVYVVVVVCCLLRGGGANVEVMRETTICLAAGRYIYISIHVRVDPASTTLRVLRDAISGFGARCDVTCEGEVGFEIEGTGVWV